MTPDRIQEIRQRLEQTERWYDKQNDQTWRDLYEEGSLPSRNLPQDITDLLAALATAEAEGRRQGELADCLRALAHRHGWGPGMGPCVCEAHIKAAELLRQLLPQTPR